MPADDEAPHTTSQRVKTVGIKRLGALAARRAARFLTRRSAALVPATGPWPPQTEGNAEPETGADPVLQVGEASCGGRGCCQDPSPRPRPTTSAQASPGCGGQGEKEARPGGLRASPGKKSLPLSESRSAVLPTPAARRGLPDYRPSFVQVDPFFGQLRK